MNKCLARLKILSDTLTPESITAVLNMPCDRCWHVGDKRGKTIVIAKENGWILDSGLSESQPLEDHVHALLSRLQPVTKKLQELSSQARLEFSCVAYSDAPPALNFPPEVIRQIADIGATLDIDLYAV